MADNQAQGDLATLLAKNEIRELTARYCWCVTRGDAAGIVELFAPDGSFETEMEGGNRRVVGREALLEFYKSVGPGFVHPLVSNHLTTVDGSRARGTCDMRNLMRQPDGSYHHAAGSYEDTFVHDGKAWKFQSRLWITLVQTP
jgi:hypothetical protein